MAGFWGVVLQCDLTFHRGQAGTESLFHFFAVLRDVIRLPRFGAAQLLVERYRPHKHPDTSQKTDPQRNPIQRFGCIVYIVREDRSRNISDDPRCKPRQNPPEAERISTSYSIAPVLWLST